jgi:hypothetical protein
MTRFFVVGVLLLLFGCSRSDPGGKLPPADKGVQLGGDVGGNADLAKRIVGKWKMADGSDYVIEFTPEGMLSVKNKAGERQVRVPDNNPPDLRYAFISETDVKAEFTGGHFAFSVRIDADKLTIRGKKGGKTISLSPDGTRTNEVLFPGSESKPLEFVRQK